MEHGTEGETSYPNPNNDALIGDEAQRGKQKKETGSATKG